MLPDLLWKNVPVPHEQRIGSARDQRFEGRLDVANKRGHRADGCRPMAFAAVCTSLRSASVSCVSGCTSIAVVAAFGTSCRSSSNRFAPSALTMNTHAGDVATRPIEARDRAVLTGSLPVVKMIGIVEVAALATNAGAVPPLVTITTTGLRTSSAANDDSRSDPRPPVHAAAEHDHHRDLRAQLPAALPTIDDNRRHQDQYVMTATTGLRPRRVDLASCWSSTGCQSRSLNCAVRPSTQACNRHTQRPSQPSIPAAVACLSRYARAAAHRALSRTPSASAKSP